MLQFSLFCYLYFAPAQIHWARWILRESLFTSLLLLGVTAAIAHFTSSDQLSKIWLYIFAAICGYAFLVRENGILLSVALFPVLVPEVIKRLLSSGTVLERVRSVVSLSIRYSSPVVIVGIIYIIFCTYNYLHYGYFQIGIHQTSHSFLARAIYPGNSDARGLLYPGPAASEEAKPYYGPHLYNSFILARDQTPQLDPVYIALYPSVMQRMSEHGYPSNTFHLASILNAIGRSMNSLVPRKADLSGLLREYAEIISLNNTGSYPLQVGAPYTTASEQELLSQLPVKVKVEEKSIESDSILANYYKFTQQYDWYSFLFVLALLSSIYILKYADPVFLAPIAIFMANCAFLIITRLVTYRYVVNLDVLLILQIILGLSAWMNKNYYVKRIPN